VNSSSNFNSTSELERTESTSELGTPKRQLLSRTSATLSLKALPSIKKVVKKYYFLYL
jgi:hypothetical protein